MEGEIPETVQRFPQTRPARFHAPFFPFRLVSGKIPATPAEVRDRIVSVNLTELDVRIYWRIEKLKESNRIRNRMSHGS